MKTTPYWLDDAERRDAVFAGSSSRSDSNSRSGTETPAAPPPGSRIEATRRTPAAPWRHASAAPPSSQASATAAPLPPRRATGAAADIVVVGGGVTGCSCALALAERGCRVRLLERRQVAAGASGRNGGFALRGGAMAYDAAVAALGRERARALWGLSERALDRLVELGGDDCRRVGSLRLAAGAGEAEALAREFEALREDGFDVDRLDRLPPPLAGCYSAALVHPHDAAVQPARIVRRLAARAVAAGAEVVEGREVRPEEIDEGAGRIGAVVVVAADALAAGLLPELAGVVRPLRGQVLVTVPLEGERMFERPHYARHGFDYWQQLPDGRLLVGGKRDASPATEETQVEQTTHLVQGRLEELAFELVGRLPRIDYRWAGVWGETLDRLPLAGRMPGRSGVWVAAGYSGHGNVLGFACGELVARAILGEEPPELELFDPARALAAAAGASQLDGGDGE